MTKPKLYTCLFLVLLLEVAFLNYQHFFPDQPLNKTIDRIANYGPGVFFSLFILFTQYKKWSVLRMMVTLSVLFFYYLAAFLASFLTWGFAIPVVGGLGGLLIKRVIFYNDSLLDVRGRKYLLAGFIAGLLGLILFYLPDVIKIIPKGKGTIEPIIVLWQLTIGWLVIKDLTETK
ncbi:MAG: hypothetical protein AB7G44_03775 [Bacteroidia bacterium]